MIFRDKEWYAWGGGSCRIDIWDRIDKGEYQWTVPDKNHSADAEAWSISDGEFVKMASRRGEIQIKARLTDKSPRGTVFTSFSFAALPVNELTDSGYDPVTGTAELKVCPVKIGMLPLTCPRETVTDTAELKVCPVRVAKVE